MEGSVEFERIRCRDKLGVGGAACGTDFMLCNMLNHFLHKLLLLSSEADSPADVHASLYDMSHAWKDEPFLMVVHS